MGRRGLGGRLRRRTSLGADDRHEPASRRTPACSSQPGVTCKTRQERLGLRERQGAVAGGAPGSTRTARTFSPPRPSARTWCTRRPPQLRQSARSVIRMTDHNGARLGSGSMITEERYRVSARSSPRRWTKPPRRAFQCGNQDHLPTRACRSPTGTVINRCRSRGMARDAL